MPPQGIITTTTSIIFINRGFPIFFIQTIKGGFCLPRFLVFLVFLKLLTSENNWSICGSCQCAEIFKICFTICSDDQWQLEHVLRSRVVGKEIGEVVFKIWVEVFCHSDSEHPLVNVEICNATEVNASEITDPSARDDVVVRCHVVSISHAPRDARVFFQLFSFFSAWRCVLHHAPCYTIMGLFNN